MNLSQLDESLLTAYLDNELSDEERQRVEEQLKINEHWKQLLKELQSVQSLIRELPTPLLARSLAEGPWSTPGPTIPASETKKENVDDARPRSYLKSILALAASLSLVAVGSFAWMRFDEKSVELAILEQQAKPEDASAISTVAELEASRSSELDTSSTVGQKGGDKYIEPLKKSIRDSSQTTAATQSNFDALELQVQQPAKLKLQSPPPMPAAKAEMSAGLSASEGTLASPSSASNATPSAEPPAPVETLIAVRAGSFGREIAGKKFNEGLVGDTRATDAKKDDYIAPLEGEATNSFMFDPQVKGLASRGLLELAPDQQNELRVLRSELPVIVQRLRELGWEIQREAVPRDSVSSTRSMRRNEGAFSDHEQAGMSRPPKLTGAILEPTDWIRIVFEGG